MENNMQFQTYIPQIKNLLRVPIRALYECKHRRNLRRTLLLLFDYQPKCHYVSSQIATNKKNEFDE